MASAQEFLRAAQDTSGGWGYYTGHSPTTEATAAVLLALRDQPESSEMVGNGLSWLRASQNEDGGWGYSKEDDESGWQTAWAVLALNKMQIMDEVYRRGVEWLMNVRPLGYAGDDFSHVKETTGASDPIIYSWPWFPGEATWVEPTTLAILALEKEKTNPTVDLRIKHSVTYLQLRHCPGGGWNVGNPVMFDVALVGRAPQTAMAILALHSVGSTQVEQQDIETMRQDMFEDGSPLGLGWGSLALHAVGIDNSDVAEKMTTLQRENGSWSDNTYHTALALMSERGNI